MYYYLSPKEKARLKALFGSGLVTKVTLAKKLNLKYPFRITWWLGGKPMRGTFYFPLSAFLSSLDSGSGHEAEIHPALKKIAMSGCTFSKVHHESGVKRIIKAKECLDISALALEVSKLKERVGLLESLFKKEELI